MKKMLLIGIATFALLTVVANTDAAVPPPPLTSTVTATVSTVFSMEWETNALYVSYPGGGPISFPNVDPTSSLNYAEYHSTAKSDIAIICKSNENATWGLKTSSTGTIPATSLLYYMAQPTVYDPVTQQGIPTSGTLANPAPATDQPWPVLPQNSVIYTSGNDAVNTPYGTYCGLSLGLNGAGLSLGGYSTVITFTMTQSL